MTTPSLEVLLVIGIIAFYVQDAMLLLYGDELVFERVARRWHPSPGGSQWQGRFLFVPNPLAPWRPLLRGAIPGAPSAIPETSSLEPVLRALRPLQVGVTLLAALLLVGVPALLWRYPHPLALSALAASIYLVALLLVIELWRRREAFGLDRRTAAWLAFGSVACPPHAINLVRKLGLRQSLPRDAMSMASDALDAPALERLKATLAERAQALAP